MNNMSSHAKTVNKFIELEHEFMNGYVITWKMNAGYKVIDVDGDKIKFTDFIKDIRFNQYNITD